MRVLFVGADRDAWPSLLLDGAGRVVAQSMHGIEPPGAAEPVLLVAPGVDVTAHWANIEARSEAQARAAAFFALEDQLGGAKDTQHLVLGPAVAGLDRLALVAAKDSVEAWLEGARARGFEAHALVPDYLLLPEPEGDGAVGVKMGALLVVRARKLAFAAEPALARQALGTRALRMVEDPSQAQAMIARSALAPLEVDMLQWQFARKKPRAAQSDRPSPLLLAGLIGALALLVPAPDWAASVRYDLSAKAAQTRAAALVKQIAPDAPSSLDPVSLVRARLQAGAAPHVAGFAAISASLFAAIEQVNNVQLDSLAYAPDGALRATLTYGAFSDVEVLRAALAQTGLVLEEGAATNRDDRFSVDVRIRSAS